MKTLSEIIRDFEENGTTIEINDGKIAEKNPCTADQSKQG